MARNSDQSPVEGHIPGAIPDPARVPGTVMMALLGVSHSTFHQLQVSGVIIPVEKSKFNLRDTVQRYIAHRVEGPQGRQKKKAKDLIEDEKLRKLRIDNDLREGLTVIRADAEAVFNSAAAVIGTGLEALPGRLAGQVLNLKDPAVAREKVQKECRKLRQEFSDKLGNLSSIQYVEAPGEDEPAESGAKGKKVRVRSGQEKSAARRRRKTRALRKAAGK